MKYLIQRVFKVFMSVMPFIIIAALLGLGLFVKPKSTGKSIDPPVIERRDRFYGIAVPERGVIWAAGNDGKIVRSTDGGKVWIAQKTPTTFHLQDISAWDGLRAVSVGNQGVVLLTADGGKTWKESQAPRSAVANKLIRVKTLPDGSAWSVGEMGAVLMSRDYGATWERKRNEEDVGWNDITFIDARNGWVVGEFGRMLHTRDGGTTWQPSKGPVQSSLTAIAFRDAMNGVAVGMEGVVLVTSDGGKSWKQEKKVTNVHLFDVAWTGDSWRAVGGKGISVVGDKAGSTWKAARLAENDLSWHTRAVSRFDVIYIAGGTTGVLEHGKWNIFSSKIGG